MAPLWMRGRSLEYASSALGRTVEPGQFLPCSLLIEGRQGVQLLLEGVLLGDGGHIWVVIGVVAHDVALLDHAADQIRVSLDHMPHHEKGGGSLMGLEHVQNLAGVAVFIAAVEGQVDHRFGGVPQVVGVILGQILCGGVAYGRLAFGGEGEAPIVRRGGHGGVSARRQGVPCALSHAP